VVPTVPAAGIKTLYCPAHTLLSISTTLSRLFFPLDCIENCIYGMIMFHMAWLLVPAFYFHGLELLSAVLLTV
jgi:hypothetical protein